jgi:hypothetical protein
VGPRAGVDAVEKIRESIHGQKARSPSLYGVSYAGSLPLLINITLNLKTPWSVVCKRTIPTKLPPLVGEVSASFSRQRVSRGQRNGSPRPLISVF